MTTEQNAVRRLESHLRLDEEREDGARAAFRFLREVGVLDNGQMEWLSSLDPLVKRLIEGL